MAIPVPIMAYMLRCWRDTRLYNTVVHGLAFMVLFAAFQTAGEYSQSIMMGLGHGDLGFLSSAVIYLVFSFANLVSPSVVRQLGLRPSFVLSSILYLPYLLAFAYPTTLRVLSGAALLGASAAVLWTAQGVFFARNSTDTTRGLHTSIFWGFLQCRLFLGNGVAYFYFGGTDEVDADLSNGFFLCATMLAASGIVIFLALRPSPAVSPIDSPYTSGHDHGLMSSIREVASLLVDRHIRKILVLSATSGVVLQFIAKYFTIVSGQMSPDTIVMPQEFNPSLVAVAGLVMNIGEILGGLGAGRLADNQGSSHATTLAISTLFMSILLIVTTFIYLWTASKIYVLLASFFIGVGDSAINLAIYTSLARHYKDQQEAAFACFKLVQSVGATIAFFAAPFMTLASQLLCLSGMMVCCLL